MSTSTEACRCGHKSCAELIAERLATEIAAAEQRGREDNADHGQCYVAGSEALARTRATAWDEGYAKAIAYARSTELRAPANPYMPADGPERPPGAPQPRSSVSEGHQQHAGPREAGGMSQATADLLARLHVRIGEPL